MRTRISCGATRQCLKVTCTNFDFPITVRAPATCALRSSWDEDATYFFFKCGDRFTAHQHLDVGHFLIYKHNELVGDGGHYDDFGSPHDVNYHLRSIAHNTILVYDPAETWPGIRAGQVTGNDGGQAHPWPHHNGAVADADAWQKDKSLYDIADITSFSDDGQRVCITADCSRAYAPDKLECFVRQIVYERPGTFVVFDRVVSAQQGLQEELVVAGHETSRTRGVRLDDHQRGRTAVRPDIAATRRRRPPR